MDGAASLRRLWRRRTRRSLPDEEEEPVESVLSEEEEELADGAMARCRGGGDGGGGEGRGCLTKNLTHVFLFSLAEEERVKEMRGAARLSGSSRSDSSPEPGPRESDRVGRRETRVHANVGLKQGLFF